MEGTNRHFEDFFRLQEIHLRQISKLQEREIIYLLENIHQSPWSATILRTSKVVHN